MNYVTLNNGVKMPMIGFGVFEIPKEETARCVYEALEVAKNYANERVTFGKPIAKYQGVAFKFADMAAKIRAIDLMVWDTAQMKSEGQRHTVEAAELKLMSSRWCCEICDEGIQVLGGNGYSREFHVERFYRDAKLLEIGEGTSEIQRMVISGAVLAK